MLQFLRKHFDFNTCRRFFVLTFVVSAMVGGGVAYLVGPVGAWSVVWESLVIAVLVGAASGWRARARAGDAAADQASFSAANDASRVESAVPPGPAPETMESLEEQGITVKLLELTALGDRYGNTFSVAMIGVDHLHDISEQYDDKVIEHLLRKISSALAHTLRMPDRVGELGHGTYLVVLPETSLRGAIQIAERLRDAVSELDAAVSDRIHVHTTASVGVTSFRRGDDILSLVQRAEKALREAQKQGRNRVLPDLAA